MYNLQDFNINSNFQGKKRAKCPQCGPTRSAKNQNDKCVNITSTEDGYVYKCFHCGADGFIKSEQYTTNIRQMDKPKNKLSSYRTDSVLSSYLDDREVTARAREKLGIGFIESWLPGRKGIPGGQYESIVFNYFYLGKVVSQKLRSADDNKLFRVAGSTNYLYNGDCLHKDELPEYLVWTEGEIDAATIVSCGIDNVVSLPNGSDSNLNILKNYAQILQIKRHIIAVDNDEPGRKLAEKLIDKLGVSKCVSVDLKGYNDPNDLAVNEGLQELFIQIIAAKNKMPEGIMPITKADRANLYKVMNEGLNEGKRIGVENIDEIMRYNSGRIRLYTGIPGHGKSTFVDWLSFELIRKHSWKFAIFSGETPRDTHIRRLSTLRLNHPVQDITNTSLVDKALDWVNENYFLFDTYGKYNNLGSILERAIWLSENIGINAVIIDNWTSIDRSVGKDSSTEIASIQNILNQMQALVKKYQLDIWLVAHPRKMGVRTDGTYNKPNGYDVGGSSGFYNTPCEGITVYRLEGEENLVEINKWKARFDEEGKKGHALLEFNPRTRRYHMYGAHPDKGIDEWYINQTKQKELYDT